MKNNFKHSKVKKENKFAASTGYNDLYPIFSFKNYIKDDKYFAKQDSHENGNLLYGFLLDISKFSQLTWFKIKESKNFHFHPINKDISELSKYDSVDIMQFKLLGQKQARVIGFFDENNVFNVLLYDYNHIIYPKQ